MSDSKSQCLRAQPNRGYGPNAKEITNLLNQEKEAKNMQNQNQIEKIEEMLNRDIKPTEAVSGTQAFGEVGI